MEIKVGEIVTLKYCGHYAKGKSLSERIFELPIVSVGKKYFYIAERIGDTNKKNWIQFHIANKRQVTNYNPTWVIVESRQAEYDREETLELAQYIRSEVNNLYPVTNLSLDQLRRIKAIIEEGTPS